MKIAILIDGAFIKNAFRDNGNMSATPDDIETHCWNLMDRDLFKHAELLRVYYYDCLPFGGKVWNPFTEEEEDFGGTGTYKYNQRFIAQLEEKAYFTVTKGELVFRGWRLHRDAKSNFQQREGKFDAGDFVPNFEQKGVDMLMGLDIAYLSLKHLVDGIILVAGDSDFIPAIKAAKQEGIQIFLDSMERPVKRELKSEADFVL